MSENPERDFLIHLHAMIPLSAEAVGLDTEGVAALTLELDQVARSLFELGSVCAILWLSASAVLLKKSKDCRALVLGVVGHTAGGGVAELKFIVLPPTPVFLMHELEANAPAICYLFGAYPEVLPSGFVLAFDHDHDEVSSGEGGQNAHADNERDLFNHLIGRAGISESWGFPGGAGDDGEGSDGN